MRKATGNGSGIKGGISQRKEVWRTRRARGINPPQTSGTPMLTLTSQVSRVEVGSLVTEALSVPPLPRLQCRSGGLELEMNLCTSEPDPPRHAVCPPSLRAPLLLPSSLCKVKSALPGTPRVPDCSLVLLRDPCPLPAALSLHFTPVLSCPHLGLPCVRR